MKSEVNKVLDCLRISDLSFSYGERPALRDISLTVKEGEILGILGPNGAGKTTLLKCLLRTVTPRDGDIELLGKSISEYDPVELARKVSYVPQETGMPFPFSVFEVVVMGRYPHCAPLTFESASERELVHKILRRTHTEEFADRLFNELSGGEKQRVLLARAIAQDAPLMLLDEPTSNLDIKHMTILLRLLIERREETGMTLIFVTHDLNLATAFADRVALIKQGEIKATGSPSEVLTPARIQSIYDTEVSIVKDPETSVQYFALNL